ncbi:MBL fold metallo-hydrolase [Ferroacidibacillus organovorans]|uniref:MBL fold metallo-hydrolase n=1 Tax=Ferroacidibacillus organovorans TaxID=1765683 RepID=UPI0009EC3271|nr:MBL fold metallo-hydrolase [Ferroacidibacillus organovorans]
MRGSLCLPLSERVITLIRYKFIGHSTVLVEVDGKRFITDPIVSNRALVVRRKRAAGYTSDDLSSIDVVLLSHAHWDHLDRPTLKKIARKSKAIVICPRGHLSLLHDLGFVHIHELGRDETIALDGFTYSLTPVNHRGKRWLERYRSSAGIFVNGGKHRFWFAGDTGYRSDFSKGMQGTAPDVALIPIGAYEPREWFHMMHMDPDDALKTFVDVKATYMLPIHWGAFKLTREEIHEPPLVLRELAKREGLEERILWLEPGEQHVFNQPIRQMDDGGRNPGPTHL